MARHGCGAHAGWLTGLAVVVVLAGAMTLGRRLVSRWRAR
jgi:hypothetical protein